jgi:hypothetical protein
MMSLVRMPQAPVRVSMSRDATATLCSTVRACPCSSMVSATTGGAVLAHERHDPVEAAARALAVLEVHAVDDRAAADELQAGLQHGGLGGVEHQRQGRTGGEPADDLHGVGDPVATHVVHADVEQVRAVAGLLRAMATHSSQRPASMASRNALSRSAFVRSPMERIRSCPAEGHVLVDARDAGLGAGPGGS